MWDRWFSRDSYYSHGILIPFVSIYLIWQRREELLKIKPKMTIPITIHGRELVIPVEFKIGKNWGEMEKRKC